MKWLLEFGPNGPNSGPKLGFFCYFLKFGSLVFLEIACNDSLQQVEVKLTEKNFGDQILAKTGQNQGQN